MCVNYTHYVKKYASVHISIPVCWCRRVRRGFSIDTKKNSLVHSLDYFTIFTTHNACLCAVSSSRLSRSNYFIFFSVPCHQRETSWNFEARKERNKKETEPLPFFSWTGLVNVMLLKNSWFLTDRLANYQKLRFLGWDTVCKACLYKQTVRTKQKYFLCCQFLLRFIFSIFYVIQFTLIVRVTPVHTTKNFTAN